jgi:hypothetical protein
VSDSATPLAAWRFPFMDETPGLKPDCAVFLKIFIAFSLATG